MSTSSLASTADAQPGQPEQHGQLVALQDANSAAGAASSAGAAPPPAPILGEDVVLVSCVFDCGPPRDSRLCTNTGTARSPRWMCQPCNGSRKALEYAALHSANPDAKEDLAKFKKADVELWKDKVRSCRVRCKSDAPGAPGLDRQGQRKGLVVNVLSFVSQWALVQQKDKRAYMDKDEYLAFLKYKKGKRLDTPEQRDAAWQALVDNPDPLRTGVGEGLKILVDKGSNLESIKGRTLGTQVNRTLGLESQAQVDTAMDTLAATGASANAFAGPAFGNLGDAMRPGMAAGSSADPATHILAAAPAKPASTSVVPLEDFAPWGTGSASHPRGLKAVLSDPATPGSSKKAKARHSSATSGPLLLAQEAARKTIQDMKVKYAQGRGNLSKQVDTLKVDFPTLASREMLSRADSLSDSLKLLDQVKKEVNWWTTSTLAANQAKLEATAQTVVSDAAAIQELLVGAQEQKATLTAERMAASRTAVANREKAVKPYLKVGTSAVLMRWLYKQDALATPAVSFAGQGSEGEAPAPAAPKPPWTYGLKWNPPNSQFTPATLSVWNKDSPVDSAGTSLRELPKSYAKRMDIERMRLQDHLEDEAGKPDRQGRTHAVVRMPPKGGNQDTVEQIAWAPKVWKDAAMAPEALRTFGAPWLVAAQPGHARHGDEGWVLPGMGCFLHILAAPCILVAFPLAEVMERGEELATAVNWVFNLSSPHFNAFFDASARAAALTPGCTAWIPYGWAPILVTRSTSATPSMVIQAPYLSPALAREYAFLNILVKYNTLLARTKANWSSGAADSLVEWMEALPPPQANQPAKAGEPLLAIQNAGAEVAVEDEGTQDSQDRQPDALYSAGSAQNTT